MMIMGETIVITQGITHQPISSDQRAVRLAIERTGGAPTSYLSSSHWNT